MTDPKRKPDDWIQKLENSPPRTIDIKKYHCPIHGEIYSPLIIVRLDEFLSAIWSHAHCAECFDKFLYKHLPAIEEMKTND